MIDYDHYTLDNGLTVVLHHDPDRTVVAVNVLYRVGSRHDPPGRTGMAHLFEHLMFGGSAHAPNFDDILQLAGGDSNAVTGADTTLYFDTLPADNLDTALWLESDRMRSPKLGAKSLATQQRVVVEEFKETCLEPPYGDLFHHLNQLVYPRSNYRWPVIGETFADIEAVTVVEARDFFRTYYRPDNAVLCVAGRFDPATIRQRIAGYFGNIAPAAPPQPPPPQPAEPPQEEFRQTTVYGDVPSPLIYLHLRTVDRLHPDFPVIDVLTYLLGGGRSSLLYRRLVRDTDTFTEISASINDNLAAGGIYIDALPSEDTPIDRARGALYATLDEMIEHGVTPEELAKVVHQLEHRNYYRDTSISSRAGELTFYTMLGHPEYVNSDLQRYLDITVEDVNRCARQYLRREVTSELLYLVESVKV